MNALIADHLNVGWWYSIYTYIVRVFIKEFFFTLIIIRYDKIHIINKFAYRIQYDG